MRRRHLLRNLSFMAAAPLSMGRLAHAQSAVLQESDPEALAVDYKTDAKKVNPAKSPKFKPGRTCANCGLFHPDGTAPTGGCDLFYGKDVTAAGWCNVWEAKT